MTFLLGMLTLDYAGVPTYVLTLTRELERRGHRVFVYCPSDGPLRRELPVCDSVGAIETEPDVILVHHRSCAAVLRARFPHTPLIFVAHGVCSPESALPEVSVDRVIAINEQVVDGLTVAGVSADRIELVRDFVDTDRFASETPLQERPRVLFLSNYKRWRNYFMVLDACTALGLPFRAVGSPYGRTAHVEVEINRADLVISWGRGILEAMACGRAVISYDQIKMAATDAHSVVTGDGYLTPLRYFEARQHNFGPRGCRHTYTNWSQLVVEIQQYRSEHGAINRQLAVAHHGVAAGVDAVLASVAKAQAVYA